MKKTIISIHNAYEPRKLILTHSKDISVTRETRPDPHPALDNEDNPILEQRYLVIRFPKSLSLPPFKPTYDDKWGAGYQENDLGDEVEWVFYDRASFYTVAYRLEDMGIFRLTQRVIPDKEKVLFPHYINANTFRQFNYNLFFGMIEVLYFYSRKGREE